MIIYRLLNPLKPAPSVPPAHYVVNNDKQSDQQRRLLALPQVA